MTHFTDLKSMLTDAISQAHPKNKRRYYIEITRSCSCNILQQCDLDRRARLSEIDTISSEFREYFWPWVMEVEDLDEDYFCDEARETMRTVPWIARNVWFVENYEQNFYWKYMPVPRHPLVSQKVLSFFSHKGGTGKTTAMLLTAIAMAQQGKKVVLVDADLESPGFFRYFSGDQLPRQGLLDYLTERAIHESDKSAICFADYITSVSSSCEIGPTGGEIFLVPACGSELLSSPEDYLRALPLFYHDEALYLQRQTTTSFDDLLTGIDDLAHPDYIMVDTRTGVHPHTGIAINRYSGLSLLFFPSNRSSVIGMETTIPLLKAYGVPYLLIHAKVPRNREEAEKAHQDYLHDAFEAVCFAGQTYATRKQWNSRSGEHCPFDLPERPELTHASNLRHILDAYPVVQKEYAELADEIVHRLHPQEQTIYQLHAQEIEQRRMNSAASALRSVQSVQNPGSRK